MAEFTFFAKPDGSSANNSSLNIDPPKGATTQITFLPDETAPDGGDVFLDDFGTTNAQGDIIDDGIVDPNTLVRVNGVEYSFEVEFSGTVNPTNKANTNGIGGEDFTIITVDPGGLNLRLVFFPNAGFTQAQAAAINNGAYSTNAENNSQVEICFTEEMEVFTPDGTRAVGQLQKGDLVRTADGDGYRKVAWVGGFQASILDQILDKNLRPLRISNPSGRALRVTQRHRIELAHPRLAPLFGFSRCFIPAMWLLSSGHAIREEVTGPVRYAHVLFDNHEVLDVHGFAVESLFMGDLVRDQIDMLIQDQLARTSAPSLSTIPRHAHLARPTLRRAEFDMIHRTYPNLVDEALNVRALLSA